MPRSFGPIWSRPGGGSRGTLTFWLVAVGALVVRLYLGWLWLQFGTTKLEMDWLTTNPVHGLLTLVANRQTPMPIPALSVVAAWLLAVRADVVLSVVLPLTEIALAAAFLSGSYVRVAALTGIAVNTSLILGGLASLDFDGRVILLQTLLVVGGTRAGELGLPGLVRILRSGRRVVAPHADRTPGPEPRRRAA